MDEFIGLGRIADVYLSSKVLKITLAMHQKSPCCISFLLFDPSDEIKEFVEQLVSTEEVIRLQGKISSSEIEHQGKIRRKIEMLTYAKSVRPI